VVQGQACLLPPIWEVHRSGGCGVGGVGLPPYGAPTCGPVAYGFASTATNTTAGSGGMAGPSVGGPISGGGLPPQPRSFPEVEALSPTEAERLLTGDEDAFEYFFESLYAVRALRAYRNQRRDHNEQLARDNLRREKELRELVEEVTLLQNKLAEKRHTLEGLLRRQDELSQRYAGAGLSARLREAAVQAEAESEALSCEFVEGRLPAQDFVRSFPPKRQLYHTRAAKQEALLRHPSPLGAVSSGSVQSPLPPGAYGIGY